MLELWNTPKFVSLRTSEISGRFAKLQGRSGRTYIVTEVPEICLSSYYNCIAVAAVRNRVLGVWNVTKEWQPAEHIAGLAEIDLVGRNKVRWFLHFPSDVDVDTFNDLMPRCVSRYNRSFDNFAAVEMKYAA